MSTEDGAEQRARLSLGWVRRMEQMGNYIGIPIDRMFADSLVESDARNTERKFNTYLITTRSGRATLAKRRFLLCANNPFRIAAVLIARRVMRLRLLTPRRPCKTPDDIVAMYVDGRLSEHIYNDPSNTLAMEAALERFVANISGGIAYGETICVPL